MTKELTIGNRIYEVLNFLKEGEDHISGKEIIERVKEMKANLGEGDCQYILDNQKDIPEDLKDNYFIFTDWRRPAHPERVACVDWFGVCWVQYWRSLVDDWNGGGRVLRRKLDTQILSSLDEAEIRIYINNLWSKS